MGHNEITANKILTALAGVFLVGVGVAFNNCAGLGNDSVGIVYDGVRAASGLNAAQLGMASNVVNLLLVVFLFFAGRRYINVGTLVYFIPYGFFVSIGRRLYELLAFSDGLAARILFSTAGCLLLYLGVAVYVTVDIGIDPFNGLVLLITDVTKREYRVVKITFDLVMIVLGTVLGGRLGAVTIITAFTAGPGIQFFAGRIRRGWGKT